MDKKKFTEGVSIKEIEGFAKKHYREVILSLSFIFAGFFSTLMFGAGWSIFFAVIGGVIGIAFYKKAEQFSKASAQFILKQEMITQLIIGAGFILLSIFIPPIVFFLFGIHGGKDFYRNFGSQNEK